MTADWNERQLALIGEKFAIVSGEIRVPMFERVDENFSKRQFACERAGRVLTNGLQDSSRCSRETIMSLKSIDEYVSIEVDWGIGKARDHSHSSRSCRISDTGSG